MKRWILIILLCSGLLCGSYFTPLPTAQAKGKATLVVSAASSLTDFIKDAVQAFQKTHPDVEVRTNIASSSELRTQIELGAPVDVFLSADMANMNPLVATKLANKPVVFAHNSLVIVVAKRAKDQIKSLGDLAKPGLKLVMAGPTVPIGNYTRQVLSKADKSGKFSKDYTKRVLANVKSEEANVRATLLKVVLGEADAGVVYATDITPEVKKSTTVIAIPADYNVTAAYPIAVMTRSKQKGLAGEFQAFVLSQDGKNLLLQRGFLP